LRSRVIHDINLEPGQHLGRSRLEELLARAAPAPDAPASSLNLRPSALNGAAGPFLAAAGPEGRAWANILARVGDPAQESDTGVVGLRAGGRALVIVPPFPVRQDRLVPAWDPAPLLELLATQYLIGVVLLRLGRFSVAVYQGEKLRSSKTDARYVKGRHRAGGSSQKRFERIREGQMRRIYDKTCEAVAAQFGPYARTLDYLVLGGERFTLNNFMKVCPYLEQFRGITLGRLLNIRDPKRDTLDGVGPLLYQSRVDPLEW
jgi:hypothetical protein